MFKYFVLLSLIFLTACSGTVPVSYQAQTLIRQNGEASIGQFSYAPYEQGSVKSNQIQNTAIGAIYIALDVADLVRRATALEMERAGIKITEESPRRVSGEVLEMKADDLGFSVDWHYSIKYNIIDATDGSVLYGRIYELPVVRTGKFGLPSDFSPSINELVRSGVEAFLNDPEVKDLLSPPTQEKRR